MNRDRALLDHFGLTADTLFWGAQHEVYASRIQDAVKGRRLIAVIGPFGSGKSMLTRSALESVDRLDVVYVNQSDREHLRIGQVTYAMITELGSENPRRDNMARNYQLSRLCGERVKQQRREVAVVIENAHRMHTNTLLALKDLRETVRYKGEAFLFSVVLVGQEPLRGKLDRFGEVAYRTKSIDLGANGWMSFNERCLYLEQVYADIISKGTRERIAAMYTTPLEMDYFLEGKLEQMRDAGLGVLDEEVFPLTIRELREALKLSLRDVQKLTGLATSTISDVEHHRNNDPGTAQQIFTALDEALERRKKAA